jgi:hypothetical protein
MLWIPSARCQFRLLQQLLDSAIDRFTLRVDGFSGVAVTGLDRLKPHPEAGGVDFHLLRPRSPAMRRIGYLDDDRLRRKLFRLGLAIRSGGHLPSP